MEDIEFVKQLTKEQLKAFIPKGETMKWLEPFDYAKIFEPKSPEDLRKLVGLAPPVGSAEEAGAEVEVGEKATTKSGKEVESIEDLL